MFSYVIVEGFITYIPTLAYGYVRKKEFLEGSLSPFFSLNKSVEVDPELLSGLGTPWDSYKVSWRATC